MKSDTDLFDSIRISAQKKQKKPRQSKRLCAWEGCTRVGEHPAPKGRAHEGEYHYFCLAHVREYNKQFNYFSGMGDDAVRDFQKDSITGLRPTWRIASDPPAHPPPLSDEARVKRRAGLNVDVNARRRAIGALEARAMSTLGLHPASDSEQIKARYKELVKIHHPDSNQGDRSSEERLRNVIQAYTLLKKSGYC